LSGNADFPNPLMSILRQATLNRVPQYARMKKLIEFYSCKLNPTQTRYTTTERELLAIVETLKEFCDILLGHKIRIFTDLQNLTYKICSTECVMRWHLLMEEFGPELIYIKGT
jgi:RNase H-like domain found in reverse transcriptase